MKLLKTTEVAIVSLALPEQWPPADQDAANVDRLKDELLAGRILPPIRITRDMRLVQGGHRVSAHIHAGLDTVRADIVEYESRAEEEIDQLSENLRRRSISREERDRMLVRLVELRTEVGESIPGEDSDSVGEGFSASAEKVTGRPRSPRRQAIREVARDTGHSEDTVERAIKRKEQPRPEAEQLVEKAAKAPPLETRIRLLARDVLGLRERMLAFVEAASADAHDVRRYLDKALDLRERLETSLHHAAEELDRIKARIRETSKPSHMTPPPRTVGGRAAETEETKERRHAAGNGPGPKRGLGGKKLRIELPDGKPMVANEDEFAQDWKDE